MIAKKLINYTIPPLKFSDNGTKALSWIGEFHVQHLPVVNGTEYLGLISEYDILDENNADKKLGDYNFDSNKQFIREDEHIYEVLKLLNENKLSIIPVVDEKGAYQGLVTLENLLDYFANANGMQDPGGIVILEVPNRDYSMSEISQIIESNDAKLLSMYVHTHTNSELLDITLKINRNDLGAIIQTFERYDYKIKASYLENDYMEDMQERFDGLMHYLSI